MTTVNDVAGLISAELAGAGSPDTEITAATIRAQSVAPGALFAALPGARAHGASFADGAVDLGAVAILTDPRGLDLLGDSARELPVLVHESPRSVLGAVASEIYGRPSRSVDVVGITGTSGKTTTTYFVEAALFGCGDIAGVIGTTGSRVGGRPVQSSLTTPEAPEFQALLAAMSASDARAVAAEVSSHALSLGRVDGTEFAVGAFLNLSQDHLDFHPTMEDYFAAKCRLFVDSPDSGVTPARRAVVVIDDEWGRRLADMRPDAVTVSAEPREAGAGDPGADWTASESERTPGGTQRFIVNGPGTGDLVVEIPLMGRFNVANALVALAIATELGVDPVLAARGVGAVRVPGRLQSVERGQNFRVLIDYAHKPGAVEAVLQSVRRQADGRVGVVIGAGGDRDSEKRPLMGAAAARAADLVIVTDDNPRSEDPGPIRAQVISGARTQAVDDESDVDIREVADRGDAIAEAVDWAEPGDIVVIAGKGHETGQEINGVIHPFDDRLRATDEIERRLARGRKPSAAEPPLAHENTDQTETEPRGGTR